jgi:hypothetical protein
VNEVVGSEVAHLGVEPLAEGTVELGSFFPIGEVVVAVIDRPPVVPVVGIPGVGDLTQRAATEVQQVAVLDEREGDEAQARASAATAESAGATDGGDRA